MVARTQYSGCKSRLEPDQKPMCADHQQQRTAFGTDSGRSALAAGTRPHAPKATFASVPLSWDGTFQMAMVVLRRQMFAVIL